MTENANIPTNQPVLPTDEGSSKQFDARFIVLKLGFAAFFVVIAGRLTHVQVLESGKYKEKARRQYEQTVVLPAVRGNFYDRNENVLVSNSRLVSLAADPKVVDENANEIAEKFSAVFGKPRSFYLSKLNSTMSSGSPKRFVWLERRAQPELVKQLEPSKLPGIVQVIEPKRLYHYDHVAGTLVGFTDVDNKGISGLEFQYDEYLKGKNGSVVMQRDGLGRARPSIDYPRVEPHDGLNIVLTIDLGYQSIVEEELKKGVARYKAVFKIATASAAYENKLVTPEKRFNAEHGVFKVALPAGKFRLIKDTHEYDWLTFQEAIELSSNIVMAKASLSIGPERLYRQARNYGFGILTGVDLPGEVRGRLKKPHEWSGTTLQTLAYGYEVAATPLQIAAAYAAVANNGVLMRPFVVSRVYDSAGETLVEQRPQAIRKVVSRETAELLSAAFEGVVERGTANDARIAGVRVAGKTGTSRKVINGRYGQGAYTASFVGYFPVEDPQVVCLVMMDNPRAVSYYGGLTSGPVFRAISERIINTSDRLTRGPQQVQQERPKNGVSVPDLRTLQVSIAEKILEGQGLKSEHIGNGEIVVRQVPEPGKHVEVGGAVKLIVQTRIPEGNYGVVSVPDLRGMSLRRAINRLVVDDFDVKVRGSGVVVEQSPSPGQRVNTGVTIQLICEPRTIVSAALY